MISVVQRQMRSYSLAYRCIYCSRSLSTSSEITLKEASENIEKDQAERQGFYFDARKKFNIIHSRLKEKVTDTEIENKIIYNSYIDSFMDRSPFLERVKKYSKLNSLENMKNGSTLMSKEVDSIVASLLKSPKNSIEVEGNVERSLDEEENSVLFPYSIHTLIDQKLEQKTIEKIVNSKHITLNDELNYGNPDPEIPASKVPCGGCGAMLQCQSPSIPGYIPSEKFVCCTTHDLRGQICQRCRFLREHNVALNVNISPDDYSKVISVIRDQIALVILVVDLLDFPCSIWPDLLDIIGTKRPVCVVGNKIDLIPKDRKGYLEEIKENLVVELEKSGLHRANIKHVSLISAKTGYGIEELITKIQSSWGFRGDVYLLGCTNVGKSSLFNALIKSDFCKSQAKDILERATVSPWPGTTLSLLKFPMLRPSGIRLYARTKRLMAENRIKHSEEKLRKEQFRLTRDPKFATLIGHIGETFTVKKEEEMESNDAFSVSTNNITTGFEMHMNPNHKDLIASKWCYDTPGTINPKQILTLLTLEELMITLPRKQIKPRTLLMKPGTTYFLAGLGRIDYEEGPHSLLLTTFSSGRLPLTLIGNKDADQMYTELIGSRLLAVPFGSQKRLQQWPGLSSQTVTIKGVGWHMSAADIVLSSAGWVAVTGEENTNYVLKVYTPQARGIHIRTPPLLPRAVVLRGNRLERSQAFRNNGVVL